MSSWNRIVLPCWPWERAVPRPARQLVLTCNGASRVLSRRLSAEVTIAQVKGTEKHVEEQLHHWGDSTAEYFKTKANEIKELLLVLASTAESMGERDQRYARHFSEFTTQLQSIAGLEDLGQVRASLVQRATELRGYVDQMANDSKNSVAQLRAEVSNYEIRLKTAENLALRDALTGLPNRRAVEERMEWRIQHEQIFCVLFLDLNRFKQVNDKHGHPAGDSLLKQFCGRIAIKFPSQRCCRPLGRR